MDIEALKKTIKKYIDFLLTEMSDVFLVELKISSENKIIVFLDADKGITIERCIRVNRALYKQIEEDNLFPNGNFSLEVSSPGVDEPLKVFRQYESNIGRKLEVVLDDESVKEGKLLEVNEDSIAIEQQEGKGKKSVNIKTTILFNQIKHAKVLVTF